ncbi:FabD/lysophospholipase-like protein, partial [Ceratobasidium sp. AG-I]
MSSLVILDALMGKIQKAGNLAQPPKPLDYFDMMAGTGTGGIEAVLLGRLGKSIDEAKVCYNKLASEVFSDKKILSSGSAFKSSKLEKVLKSIIGESTGDPNERMLDSSLSEKCKVFVCAMSKHNMNAGIPCLMRTYVAPEHQMPNCTIWEALRATTAHPELFKSIDIGEPNVRESFVDGGLGCNNPILQLLLEAKLIFPGRYISSITSIGAGHTRTIQIPKPSPFQRVLPVNALIAAKDIATDCERIAQEVSRRFQNVSCVYFRFNVDQGLQNVGLGEWERLGEVTAHTRAYLSLVETSQRLDSASEVINSRKKTIATTEIDGQVSVPMNQIFSSVKNCPPPTPVFTGREKEIGQINSCFFDGALERRIFVLHGLGGAGKTQTALRFVEATQDKFMDIVYVDATSRETISASLKGFAIAKNLGKSPDDTIRCLSNRQECWLLMFNNADDPEIDLRTYFPKGTHGNILITTRNRDLGLLACGNSATCEISGMEPEEALQLLLKTARMQGDTLPTEEKEAASEILQEFGHLALAIIQAGAYIWRLDCSLSLYRELYHKRRQALLEEYKTMPIKVDDYQKTVYTTWVMSFERLGARAVDMLQLLAFLHNDGILEDMFRRAAASIIDYTPVIPMDEKETSVHVWLKEFLAAFALDGDHWDSQTFLGTMAEITNYSLISYDRLNRTYSIHPLVHLWARTTPSNVALSLEHTARLLALSVDWSMGIDGHGFRQTLGPHVDEILRQQPQPNVNNLARYVTVFQETGRLKEVETMNRRLLDETRQM